MKRNRFSSRKRISADATELSRLADRHAVLSRQVPDHGAADFETAALGADADTAVVIDEAFVRRAIEHGLPLALPRLGG